MAEISNVQVVKFANEQVRPVADKLYGLYYLAKQVIQNYNVGGISALITAAGSSNLIADGSASDGRTRLSGDDVFNLITALQAYTAFVEGAAVATLARLDVVTKPHVNATG